MSLNPILLAEDDANDTAIFQKVYEQSRIRNPLRVFEDGEDIVKYLGSGRADYPLPTMLFLDLKMRRVGGLEVLGYIQKNFKREFPVIVLTGMEAIQEMRLAYQSGAHSFLMKPLQKADFAAFVEKFKGVEFEVG
jgi:CheY-like chemotaxis protein